MRQFPGSRDARGFVYKRLKLFAYPPVAYASLFAFLPRHTHAIAAATNDSCRMLLAWPPGGSSMARSPSGTLSTDCLVRFWHRLGQMSDTVLWHADGVQHCGLVNEITGKLTCLILFHAVDHTVGRYIPIGTLLTSCRWSAWHCAMAVRWMVSGIMLWSHWCGRFSCLVLQPVDRAPGIMLWQPDDWRLALWSGDADDWCLTGLVPLLIHEVR